MRDALKAAGLDKAPRIELEEGRYRCYLEAHIEQGGLLEHAGKRIGVVTAIVGIYAYRLTFSGIQNHAGTTPMPIRKDAGVAMMRLYNEVMERFPALAGPRSVWTVGKMSVEPGAAAIIPGKAEMILQFRDADVAVLKRLEACLDEIVAAHNKRGPCSIECVNLSRTMPAPMEERLQEALDDAAEKHAAGQHMRMPSGAGHDAQILAQRLPVGHDVRAVDRRHLASLHGEHGGRGHRAGLPGVRRRCGEDPEEQLILESRLARGSVHALQSSIARGISAVSAFCATPSRAAMLLERTSVARL